MGRESRSAETRRKILAVAETQFASKGYEGAHLQDIASEVGVRKTALYYYFPSKSALCVAVLGNMLENFERVIETATSRGEPSADTMEQLLDNVNDVLAEHPNYSQILIRIFIDPIAIDAAPITPMIERIIGSLSRFYAAGVEKGVFRKLSSRHFFQTVLGASLFHYAAGDIAGGILGVDDVFSADAVAWRRDEFRKILTHGVLPAVATKPERVSK